MADQWSAFPDLPTAKDPWAAFPSTPIRDQGVSERGSTYTPAGRAHDGDTFPLNNGRNGRLYGVDAFELDQRGRDQSGASMPLGTRANNYLVERLSPSSQVIGTGQQSYGRPIVTATNDGRDVGGDLVGSGNALPVPQYLSADPDRLKRYVQQQREAIAAERGAYAGQYQNPSDYRREGEAAPWRGKIPMTTEQVTAYSRMVRDPRTKPVDLEKWFAEQGHQVTNADNILSFMREHPKAAISPWFQQEDVTGEAVLPNGPGAPTRVLAGVNEGLAKTLGAPVDLVSAGFSALGVPVSETPVMGSDWIRDRLHDIGIGQLDQSYAPRSVAERYAQSIADAAGQSILPVGGTLAAGGRFVVPVVRTGAAEAGPVGSALRNMAVEAFENPGTVLAAEAGGAVGAGTGGQAARDTFPGNPWADMAGQIAGGFAGGIPAGLAATRGRPLPERVAGAVDEGSKKAADNGRQGAEQQIIGEGVPNAAADFLPAIKAPAGVAQWNEQGAPLVGMIEGAPQYGVPGQPGSRPPADRLNLAGSTAPDVRPARGEVVQTAPAELKVPPAASPEEVRSVVNDWAAQHGGQAVEPGAIPQVMFHGSPRGTIDQFDPYGQSGYGLFGAGTYLTDNPGIAASYTGKGAKRVGSEADRTVYAVRQNVQNPLDMDAPADRAKWEDTAREVLGDWGQDEFFSQVPKGASNEAFWREVEDHLSSEGVSMDEGRETMDALIRGLGNDGITHIGGGRAGNGPNHRVVIALDPEQTEVVGKLSIQHMTNPSARAPDWIDIGKQAPSDRVLYEPAPVAAMANEGERPATLLGPTAEEAGARPSGASATAEPDLSPRATLRPLNERATAEQIAERARSVNPEDVTPIPSNVVQSPEEAAAIAAEMRPEVEAPNPRDALPPYTLPGQTRPRRNPLDLNAWLRTKGGVQDYKGELKAIGVDNRARDIPLAGDVGLPKLVNEQGMTLDQAAHAAWEAGYFPNHTEPPSIPEFLDAMGETQHGGYGRVFHPDDYAAVEDYYNAADEAQAIEAGKARGEPLHAERGQPIDMEDLERNQPPATAYEDLPSVAEKAGNIDVSKLESRGDIVRAILSVHRANGGFEPARRGRISHAETEALARDLNMTADDLLRRRQGQALNAEQALAARSILAKSGDELVKLAEKAKGGSDADLAAFRKAWIRHVAIQEQVAGLTAEAGRTLSQFRAMASANIPVGRINKLQIDEAGGREGLEEAAQAILDAQGDPANMNQTARLALKPKLKDKLVELYYNSLLSGPQTHAVNILSNALTASLQIPEHVAGFGVGAVRRALLQGRANTDRVLASEVGSRASGLMQGAREGLRAFANTARTGIVPDHVSKVEAASQEAISGLKGKIIRTPSRLLSAEDELFKAIGRRMELNGLARRKAASEGLTGAARRQRVADLVAHPTDDMIERAMNYARYITFQRPLGPLGQDISRMTQRTPALKLIIPFVRTPTNIMKFALERSPAAPLLKEWRNDFMAGGAKRDLAIAKMGLGTGLGILATQWAQDGLITGGGPADKNARRLMEADGWQPYSVRLGDKYYSYQRLDPIASTLGVAADLVETSSHMTEKQRERAAMLVTMAIVKNLSNKVWLSGVVNLGQALDDPDRYARSFLAQTAGSIAVPTIVAQAAKVVDPVLRDAQGMTNRIKSRVPVLSRSLPARHNIWGEVVTAEGGVGPDMISPMRTRTARNDPITKEVLRLDAEIGPVPKRVGKRDLSPAEYSRYAEVAGKLLRAGLIDEMRSDAWKALGDQDRRELIDQIKRDTRAEARETLGLTNDDDSLPSTGGN